MRKIELKLVVNSNNDSSSIIHKGNGLIIPENISEYKKLSEIYISYDFIFVDKSLKIFKGDLIFDEDENILDVSMVDNPQTNVHKVIASINRYNDNIHEISDESVRMIANHYNKFGELPDIYIKDGDYKSWYNNGSSPVLCKLDSDNKVVLDIKDKTYSRADVLHAFNVGHSYGRDGISHGKALLEYKEENEI
jgi:hypothetical protein